MTLYNVSFRMMMTQPLRSSDCQLYTHYTLQHH